MDCMLSMMWLTKEEILDPYVLPEISHFQGEADLFCGVLRTHDLYSVKRCHIIYKGRSTSLSEARWWNNQFNNARRWSDYLGETRSWINTVFCKVRK